MVKSTMDPKTEAERLTQSIIDQESDPGVIALIIANLAQYLADFTY